MYRALSVRQPWANLIASGEKMIEVRSWSTMHRGDLVICSAVTVDDVPAMIHDLTTDPCGVTICVVQLVDVRPLERSDVAAAMLPDDADLDGAYAWVLAQPRRLAPHPVKGALGLFGVPSDIVVPV